MPRYHNERKDTQEQRIRRRLLGLTQDDKLFSEGALSFFGTAGEFLIKLAFAGYPVEQIVPELYL